MDEFTTSESVLNYLSTIADGAFVGDSCTRLSGGFGNFVWRVQLKNSYQRMSSVILKHGKDYAAASREISFPLDRMAFELDALNIFSSIFPSTNIHDDMPSVRVPRVLHADLESHVLIIEDAGDHPSLKTFLSASPPHPSATSISIDVGKALGTFLRTLHELGRNNTTYRRLFSNNTTARNLCAWRDAGRLEQAVQQYGGSEYLNATREIDGFIQSAIHKSEETFNMGDFWTGNILIETSKDQQPDGSTRLVAAWVIDWELAKYGPAATDLGQFCAEAWNLARFKHREAGNALLDTFKTAYLAESSLATSVKPSLAAEVAVNAATHIVVWTPHTGWSDDKSLIETVEKEGLDHLITSWKVLSDAQSKQVNWYPQLV